MSHTARVGAFMLAALVVLGVFIVKIEEIPIGSRAGRVRVQAVFPSVAGLDEKSAVRVAGVRVGIVENISLQGDRALATLSLERSVVLHQGARAEVTSLGMLGDKYVELYPGLPSAPPLPPGTTLNGTSPIGFDQALKSFNSAFENIDAVTGSLRSSLAGPEGEKRLNAILDNIRQLTASVRDLVQANRANVDATVANMRSFSDSLKTELPRLADKLAAFADHLDALVAENRGNLDASIANVKQVTSEMRVTVANINKITGKIASGQGSVGKLVNESTTVDNLNSTLASARGAADTLKNTLGRPERWQLDMTMRTEALPGLTKNRELGVLYNSRSAFGLDLHTTPARFYRLELVDSPVGRVNNYTQTITSILPNGQSQTVVEETHRVSDTNTVNAQVGFQLNDYTFRAGLFESRGGVGIDRALLHQRLRLTLEAYDFTREIKPPHIRFETRYFLTRNLFAYAGLDDPVWAQARSVLFGGGVTWRDEDVKYLLGTMSSIGAGK